MSNTIHMTRDELIVMQKEITKAYQLLEKLRPVGTARADIRTLLNAVLDTLALKLSTCYDREEPKSPEAVCCSCQSKQPVNPRTGFIANHFFMKTAQYCEGGGMVGMSLNEEPTINSLEDQEAFYRENCFKD